MLTVSKREADGVWGNGYVLITGCSSGIGLAVAKGLRSRGKRVIATARRLEDVRKLQEQGFEALFMDMDDVASIEVGFRQAEEVAGSAGIWAVFCNAGYGQPGAVEDLTSDGLEAQLRTNVIGTHAVIRSAIRHMRANGGGRIMVNSSILGFCAGPMRSAYVASKFALEGIADCLRLELAGSGISVSLLQPGPVLTRFRANGIVPFERYVVRAGSVFESRYEALGRKLRTEGPVARFTLPAESCIDPAWHAFAAKRPRARYPVTFPTKLMRVLKRLLPTRVIDRMASGT
jgi:NAD(P)-dependent dehydrogenase (short-subunit alcohol dehydrogenase family)